MENSLIQNTLYYTESLCNVLEIDERMRVLDLGCGTAISSIFLAREFGAQVWAVDREIPPSDNYQRILLSILLFPGLLVEVQSLLPFQGYTIDGLVSWVRLYCFLFIHCELLTLVLLYMRILKYTMVIKRLQPSS